MEEQDKLIEALQLVDGVLEDTEYRECTFRGCSFATVVMRNVKFVNCIFADCVLKSVTFRACSMLNSTFRNCALVGLDWSSVRRHGARLPLLTAMRSCTIKYNTFIDVSLARMDFAESTLHDCYFQDCSLKQALFRGGDLQNTVFQNCDLSKADFREARNYSINVQNNKVAKARFSLPEAVGLLAGFDIVIE